MPLTDKGREILNQMERDHGSTVTVPVVAPVAEASDQAKLDAVMGMCQSYDKMDGDRQLVRELIRTMAKEGLTASEIYNTIKGMHGQETADLAVSVMNFNTRTRNIGTGKTHTTLDDVMATCDEYEKKDTAGSSQAAAAQVKMRQCKSMVEYHKKCSTVNDIRLANAHVKAAQWYQEAYQAYYDAWSWYKDGDLRGGDKAMQVANEYGARADTLSEEL